MAHQRRKIEYKCAVCGRELDKESLVAKQAVFKEMGRSGRVIRSRIVAWLCRVPQDDGSPSCLSIDSDYDRPLYAASPGMADTSLAEDAASA